jgi:predicted dehydrogenase
VSIALIGAGQREFYAYGPFGLEEPEALRFVAVAEPVPVCRGRFANGHDVPLERQFSSWEDLLDTSRIADAVLIATPDRLHHAPAVATLESDCHVLIEKPMATTVPELTNLVAAADRTGRLPHLCHVLRHAPIDLARGSGVRPPG